MSKIKANRYENTATTDGGIDIDSSGKVTFDGVNVGRGAGDVATNTVVGNNALDANTSGAFNTAIGDEVLTSNTTGQQNTATG